MTGSWQPIQTAPVDGTSILVWCSFFRVPFIAFYREGRVWNGGIMFSPSAIPREWTDVASHWMPLPEAPAQEAAE